MNRSVRRLLLAAAVLVAAILALGFTLRQQTISANALDDLGDGYEVVHVSELDCGQGRRAICSREFSLRHEGSRDDLRQALIDAGITDEGYGDPLLPAKPSDPGRSDVQLVIEAGDPSPPGLFALVVLFLALAGTVVALAGVVIGHVVRRLRPNNKGLGHPR